MSAAPPPLLATGTNLYNPKLKIAWNYSQVGLLALPLFPLIGILILLGACSLTWWQKYRQIIRRPVNWGLAIFTLWLIITASLAFDQKEAFIGLFNFLPYFFVFAGYSTLIQTTAQLRRWAWILVITSLPVVLIGFGQLFWGWATHFQVLWILVDWIVVPHGDPPGRMASVFMYANTLAGYLVIVFCLGLGLWIETVQALLKRAGGAGGAISEAGGERVNGQLLSSSNESLRVIYPSLLRFAFLTVVVFGDLVGLILTDSRNAWAIAIGVGLAFAIYQGWRWLVAGVAVAAGSILWAAFGPTLGRQELRAVVPAFFWARLTDQLYPNRPTQTLRATLWQFAWNLTKQHPWLGWGLRNFTVLYQAQAHIWLGHPHNFFLMLTAETGIPGAVFFCGWVFWIWVQGLQLLSYWANKVASSSRRVAAERLIFFSYLLAFFSCIVLNTVDVTIFDARLNSLGWLLLAAISGVTYHRAFSTGVRNEG